MKKRGILAILLLSFVLAFTACGGSKDEDGPNEEQIKQSCQNLLETLESTPDSELSAMLAYYQSSAKEDESAALNAALLEDFIEARPQLGAFNEFGEFTLVKSGKTYTATQRVDYSDRDIDLVYVISALDNDITAININIVYSMGEIMGKAGLNTLMGIMIVFCMLILMFLVISCFKFIPDIEAALKGGSKDAPAPAAPAAAPVVAPAASPAAAAADDDALIAVIAAAIAASTGTTTDDFIVRSIRRR